MYASCFLHFDKRVSARLLVALGGMIRVTIAAAWRERMNKAGKCGQLTTNCARNNTFEQPSWHSISNCIPWHCMFHRPFFAFVWQLGMLTIHAFRDKACGFGFASGTTGFLQRFRCDAGHSPSRGCGCHVNQHNATTLNLDAAKTLSSGEKTSFLKGKRDMKLPWLQSVWTGD